MNARDFQLSNPEQVDATLTTPAPAKQETDPSSVMHPDGQSSYYTSKHARGEDAVSAGERIHHKKHKTEEDYEEDGSGKASQPEDEVAPIPAATEGIDSYGENDVLSGRGGGTNVHPGNRRFRDLINLHRRAYLKARKNDKPTISRAIVRSIRDINGKFLKKDDKSGLWFEIGDDAAREKTSQALRQRAPEMRKLLFDTEMEEARVAAEQNPNSPQHQPQQMQLPPQQMPIPNIMMGFAGMSSGPMNMANPMVLNQAFMAMANKAGNPNGGTPFPSSDMFVTPMFSGPMCIPNNNSNMNVYQAGSPPS